MVKAVLIRQYRDGLITLHELLQSYQAAVKAMKQESLLWLVDQELNKQEQGTELKEVDWLVREALKV